MYKRLLPAMLALASINAQAFEFPVEIIEYIDNAKVVGYVQSNDIDTSLNWAPFHGAPPLTIEQALHRVMDFIQGDTTLDNAQMVGIELKPIPDAGYWHYLVKLKYGDDDQRHAHFFMVLMDGKVISAIREPQSIK